MYHFSKRDNDISVGTFVKELGNGPHEYLAVGLETDPEVSMEWLVEIKLIIYHILYIIYIGTIQSTTNSVWMASLSNTKWPNMGWSMASGKFINTLLLL